jgi:hypothetical protein
MLPRITAAALHIDTARRLHNSIAALAIQDAIAVPRLTLPRLTIPRLIPPRLPTITTLRGLTHDD